MIEGNKRESLPAAHGARAARRWLLRVALAATPLLGSAEAGAAASAQRATDAGAAAADIVRDGYGVPHIQAADQAGLAYGIGYASAQDHLCLIADQIVRVTGARSRLFGIDPANPLDPHLVSDVGMEALGLRETARSVWPTLSQASRDAIRGYVAGYNQYVRETPPERRPEACRDSGGVREIEPQELFAYHLLVGREASGVQFIAAAYLAAPPPKDPAASAAPEASAASVDPKASPMSAASAAAAGAGRTGGTPTLPWPAAGRGGLGSNAVAVGRDLTRAGGLLLGTPHFPYHDHYRFYEFHARIPGRVDARGAGLLGFPLIHIGFNRQLAWTHTVATSEHFIVYRLDLDPEDPTRYLVDGVSEPMSVRTVGIPVRRPDGSLGQVEHTLYRSRFGMMIRLPGALDWDRRHAYALKDANEAVTAFLDQWLSYPQAGSTAEVAALSRLHRGNPWVNTLAADRDGQVYYGDLSRVFAVQPAAEALLAGDGELGQLRRQAGFTILPGNRADGWLENTPENLVPPERAPQLERTDIVANFNNTPRLTNLRARLTNYSTLYGAHDRPLSPRAQRGLTRVAGLMGQSRVAAADLKGVLFDNTAQLGQQILPDLLDFCAAATDPTQTRACAALRQWDGRFDLNSRGAHLFREFATRYAQRPAFAVPYSAAAPLTTPSGLDPARKGEVLATLGEAAQALSRLGIALDAPLHQVQFLPYFDAAGRVGRQPWAGGDNASGALNIAQQLIGTGSSLTPVPGLPLLDARTALTAHGHQIHFGTSYVQLVRFDANGVDAQGLLSYSQSSDRRSPHYLDQAGLYQREQLRPLSLDWPSGTGTRVGGALPD